MVYLVKKEYLYFLAILKNFFTKKDFYKYFSFIFFVYFIGYFGIIVHSENYADDYQRSTDGVFGFKYLSRFASEFLSKIVYLNYNRNVDAAPITQILAIILLCVSSMFLVYILNKKFGYFTLLASSFLGLSPFFLENMSYKFDSVFMSLSLALNIFCFLFFDRKILFAFISFFCLLACFNLYQAGHQAFLILSFFVIFTLVMKGRNFFEIIKISTFLVICFLIPTIFYKALIMHSFSVQNYTASSIFGFNDLFIGVFKNILRLLEVYKESFTKSQLILFFSLCMAFILTSYRVFSINKNNFIVPFLFLFVSISFSSGLFILLQHQLFNPRNFNGIGVLFAIISIFLLKGNFICFKKILIVLASYFLILESNVYANAMRYQNDYNKFRFEMMLKDLGELLPDDNKYRIFFSKNENLKTDQVDNSAKSFPIINKTDIFNIGWLFWHYGLLEHLNFIGFIHFSCVDNSKVDKILSNHYHKIIKYDNNCIEIQFK